MVELFLIKKNYKNLLYQILKFNLHIFTIYFLIQININILPLNCHLSNVTHKKVNFPYRETLKTNVFKRR
jgi:hypothetical protein